MGPCSSLYAIFLPHTSIADDVCEKKTYPKSGGK